MRSTLFAVASAISLLLCLATLVLWVRSLGHYQITIRIGPERYAEVQSVDGVIGLEWARDSWSRTLVAGSRIYGWSSWRSTLPTGRNRADLQTPTFNRFGFGVHVIKTIGPPQGIWRFGNRRLVIVYLPYWLVATITALLPLRWLTLFLRQRSQNRSGYCASCGYNLTGNTTGICSECGVTVAEARTRRARRIQRAKRAVAVLIVIVLAPIIGHTALEQYRDHLARKAVFAHQHRLLNFTAAPDLISYTEDPVLSQRLLASDPHYVRIGNCACYVQDVLNETHEVPGLHFGNGPPTLFIHGRRSPDGTTLLVAVPLMALEDCVDLRADVFGSAANDEPGLYRRGESQLVLRRWPRERIMFMAGQADPTDPSHFTIGYRLGEAAGTIDGWLLEDGTVKMQVRDGPAQTLSASPTVRPLTGGTWGASPSSKHKR